MRNPTIIAMKPIQELLQQAQANDAAATEALVREYYRYVLRLCLSMLDDSTEAEDAAQETFIAAARNLPGYRGEAEPKTWLYAIAVNTCRGRLRKRRARHRLENSLRAVYSLFQRTADPEQVTIQNEADWQVWQAVDSLGEKHRLPVILRYVHELSTPEIAAILNLSEGTVHSRLHYARQHLYKRLSQPGEEVKEVPHDPVA
jgi:RNA polymerase sigma-70 factor (ECF subfamily)